MCRIFEASPPPIFDAGERRRKRRIGVNELYKSPSFPLPPPVPLPHPTPQPPLRRRRVIFCFHPFPPPPLVSPARKRMGGREVGGPKRSLFSPSLGPILLHEKRGKRRGRTQTDGLDGPLPSSSAISGFSRRKSITPKQRLLTLPPLQTQQDGKRIVVSPRPPPPPPPSWMGLTDNMEKAEPCFFLLFSSMPMPVPSTFFCPRASFLPPPPVKGMRTTYPITK